MLGFFIIHESLISLSYLYVIIEICILYNLTFNYLFIFKL